MIFVVGRYPADAKVNRRGRGKGVQAGSIDLLYLVHVVQLPDTIGKVTESRLEIRGP
jgi:hypothetical protein